MSHRNHFKPQGCGNASTPRGATGSPGHLQPPPPPPPPPPTLPPPPPPPPYHGRHFYLHCLHLHHHHLHIHQHRHHGCYISGTSQAEAATAMTRIPARAADMEPPHPPLSGITLQGQRKEESRFIPTPLPVRTGATAMPCLWGGRRTPLLWGSPQEGRGNAVSPHSQTESLFTEPR